MSRLRRKISNELLVILVIILSLVAIFEIFGKGGITGYATTGTGNVTVSIIETVGCEFKDLAINLGTFTTYLDSNQSEAVDDNWTLTNTGTVNISINLSVFNVTTYLWTTQRNLTNQNYWLVRCIGPQSGTCNGTAYVPIANHTYYHSVFIQNLSYISNWSNVTIGVNATLPEGEPSGQKNGSIYAKCYKYGP